MTALHPHLNVHTLAPGDPHHTEHGHIVEAHYNGLGQEVDVVLWPHGERGWYWFAELVGEAP